MGLLLHLAPLILWSPRRTHLFGGGYSQSIKKQIVANIIINNEGFLSGRGTTQT